MFQWFIYTFGGELSKYRAKLICLYLCVF